MKLSFKIIKGTLLAILAIGVFCLNLNIPPAEPQQIATTQEHYFVNTAFATTVNQDVPPPPAATPPAATPPAATPPAATPAAGTNTNDTVKPAEPLKIPGDVLKTISKVSTYVFNVFNPLIYFFTKHIGNLLGNDYIYGGAMGEMLHLIWIVSRNIVNIVFVLILLFLALKHIFSGDENTDLKKTIPKFVIMLIAINFSWLAAKVVLDAANVAANVVFAIPSGVKGIVTLDTNTEKCKMFDENGKEISSGYGKKTNTGCMLSQIWIPADATEEIHMLDKDCLGGKTGKDTVVAKGYFVEAYPPGKPPVQNKTFSNKTTYCWKNLEIDKFSRTSAAYHLTYGMMRVQNLAKAQTKDSIAKVGIGTLFSLAIQIVYLTAFGCLFIALIIRVVIIWIFVATSPFLVLMYYLKNDFQFGGSEKFSHMEFIKWAIAPAKVAGVWALGFIMITTGQTATGQFFAKLDEQSAVTSNVFSVSSLFMGMDSLQEFMWLIMTVGIIWIGTFAVFSDLKVVSAITDKVNDAGKSVARLIGRSPQYLPIIPMIDPETGKLERKSYRQMFPRGFVDGITRYGAKPEDKLPSALSSLKEKKNEKHLLGLQDQAKIGDHNGKQLHDALISGSGGHITHEGLKTMNESTLAEMLQGAGVEEKRSKKIAKNIIDYANTVPETATAPVAKPEAGGHDISKDVETGVRDALRTEKIELKDAEALKPKIMDKTKEIMKAQPALGGKEAALQAIAELKKDDEFKKALAALPKNAGAESVAGTGEAAGSTGSTGSTPARGGGAAGTVAHPPAGGAPTGTP